MQRRLLHCTRCLRAAESKCSVNVPSPSLPEPVVPPNPSIKAATERVSLAANSVRKVPAKNWEQSPEAAYVLRARFYNATSKDKELREAVRKRISPLPPIPTPTAVHCIIERVPASFTTQDVLRLVPYDPTRQTEHPVREAVRLYLNNLAWTPQYLLRFAKPADLQAFLLAIPTITVFGTPIRAKLFFQDADKNQIRPGAILAKGMTLETVLRFNNQAFSYRTGTMGMTIIEGIPKWVSMGTITYTMLQTLAHEKFDWAYPWNNTAGFGQRSEKNAVPISNGEGYPKLSRSRRWAFLFKDRETAWRFARKMHLTYFREEKYGRVYPIKAMVME